MPFAPGTFDPNEADEEEEGLLGKILGFAQDPLKNVSDQDNVLLKNAKGTVKFLNPVNLTPALVGGIGGGAVDTALEAARAVPSAIASTGVLGKDIKKLEESPFSFLTNTEYIKNNMKNEPLADKLMANIKEVSPLFGGFAEGLTQTGTRLMAENAAAATRTGLFGPQKTSRELLAGRKAEGLTYGEQAEQGNLFPTVVQDLLAIAPAARGVAGGLKAAGAEATAARLTNVANFAERAPMAPYSVPAKGIYNAIKQAGKGQTAFPRLAGQANMPLIRQAINLAEKPGIGTAIQVAEKGAKGVGKTWEATRYRAGILDETARAMRGRMGEIEGLKNGAVDTAEARAATTEALRGIDNEVMAEAKAKAIQNLGKQGPMVDAELMSNLEKNIETFGKDSPIGQSMAAEKAKILDARKAELGEGMVPVAADGTPWNAASEGTPIYINEKAMDSAIKGMHAKNIDNYAVDAFDAVTGAWKSGVLPLNPAWQVGNIVSNMVTAVTYGGVSPEWYFKNRARIREQLKDASEGGGASLGSGQASEFIKGDAKTAAGQGMRKLTDKMYKLNERIDNETHMAIYLSELDKLKAKGITGRQAENMANARSLEVAGNFKNLSSAEREIVRRAIPFYTWSKHSTKMSLREAMNNPVRQLRLSTIADKVQGDAPEGLDFLEGAIPLGDSGQFLRLPGGGGQLGLGGVEESPLTNPMAAVGALNPILTAPLAGLGFNPRAGRTMTTGASQNKASQMAGYLMNQLPATKAAADMLERQERGENVVKGDTRSPLLVNRRPVRESKQDLNIPGLGSLPAPLLRFFSGAMIDEPDIRAAGKRQREKEKDDKKDVERHEKDSKRSAR